MGRLKYGLVLIAGVLTAAELRSEVLFSEDFEDTLSNFTWVINVDDSANENAYSATQGWNPTNGVPAGTAAHVGNGLIAGGGNTLAAGWIQANGVSADPSSDFTLTVDLKFEQEGTYDDCMLFLGDLDGKNYYRIGVGEHSGTRSMYLIAGGTRNATETDTYSAAMEDDTWYTVTVNWTAVSSTLSFDVAPSDGGAGVGFFSVVLDGSGGNNPSLTSLASGGVQFGFGTFNDRSSFDNIEVEGTAIAVAAPVDPPDPEDPGEAVDFSSASRLFGIDFNCNDVCNMPVQSLSRSISGSSDPDANAPTYSKTIGPVGVTVSQSGGANFEFHGANADSLREIPGGDISRSFMVADFIGTHEGAVEVTFTNLPAGDYLFRSFHLDPFDGSGLGYAQGASGSTANTFLVRSGSVLLDLVHPTALGSSGLGTTFIDNLQVPTLAFAFSHDGSPSITFVFESTKSPNGTDFYLFMNGFELFEEAL